MKDIPGAEKDCFLRMTGCRWQYAIAVIILFVGMAASIAIYGALHYQEQSHMVRSFERASYDRIAATEKTLDFDFLALQAIRVFYNGSDHVNRHEFSVFVKPFIQDHPSIHAIEWAPRVSRSERSTYKKMAVEEGLADFHISEINRQGMWSPAPDRSEYFPVFFAEPPNHSDDVLGNNLASIPACRIAMEKARDTGKCVFTSKITTFHPNECGEVRAFLPVYQNNVPLNTVHDRRHSLKGYIVGIFSLEWIIKEGLASLMPAGVNVELFDITDPKHPELLCSDPSRFVPKKSEADTMASPLFNIRSTKSLEVAGRRWDAVCTATPAFIAANKTWSPLLTSIGIVSFTFFLGLYLIGIANKNIKITKLADQLAVTNQQLKKESVERKQAEMTLRASELKYKTLYNASADAIMYADLEKGMLGGNPATIAMFGCKDEEEFTHHNPADLSPEYQPDGKLSRVKAREVMAIAMEKGSNYFEWKHKRMDGSEFFATVLLTRLELEGQPIILATVRDITEQRRAEEAFKTSERRLRLFAENVEDVLWTMKNTGQFTYFSPSVEPMLGFKWEEGMSVTMADIMTPSSLEVAREALEMLTTKAQSGQPVQGYKIEMELLRKDKTTLWGEATVSAMYDESGEVIGMLGVTRDITERKKMEEERALTTQRTESLLALNRMADRRIEEITATAVEEAIRLTGSQIGYLATMDEEETVLTMLYWSKSAHPSCKMTDKPITYPLKDTGLWGEAARQRQPIITNDYAAPNPYKRGTPEGHIPLQRHMNIPVFDGKKIVAVAGVGNKASDYDERDLTQLKLMMDGWQQILSRKQFELALARARDDAESATRAKSRFLATMSHEIRTPMTAILGYADLLLDPSLDAKARNNYAVTIRRSGEHLLTLINDILDISKIEAGKMVLDIKCCNIASLLADVTSIVRPHAESHGIDFSIEYSGAIPETILTDGVRLRQAITNLTGNAVKFTEKGSVRIVVSLIEKEKICGDQPAIQFQIIDTGIGIKKETLSKLFRPFSQGDASITQRFGGTGLGLTISHHIAHLLGGDLTVNSVWGKGSTFSLTIPTGSLDRVRLLRGSTEVIQRVKENTWQSMAKRLQGVRVLLAEDGEDNRRLIKAVLSKAGAVVETVENGRQAVERAENETFDLILMDMNMPEMDGYEATSLLRNQGYSKPILALTANAMREDCERCQLAGCDEYLTKPIDRILLVRSIAKYVTPSPPNNANAKSARRKKSTHQKKPAGPGPEDTEAQPPP